MRSVTGLTTKRASKPVAARRAPTHSDVRLPWGWAGRDVTRRALVLALAAAFTFGMIQLLGMPQLNVSATSTQIGGVQRITREQIYEASGVAGRNIFLVRPTRVEAAVTQIGGIATAQVHVRLPNQVLIDVREDVPLIAWQGITTTLWLTADGTPVPQRGEVPPLTLIDEGGMLPASGSPLTPMLLTALAGLRAARPDVIEVNHSKSHGLSFRTAEGWDVWLGDSAPLADKLKLLEVARQEIIKLGRQAQVIDLRHSNQRVIWW